MSFPQLEVNYLCLGEATHGRDLGTQFAAVICPRSTLVLSHTALVWSGGLPIMLRGVLPHRFFLPEISGHSSAVVPGLEQGWQRDL